MPHRRWWTAALVLVFGAVGSVALLRSLPGAEARRGSLPAVLTTCAARPPVGGGVAAQPGTFFHLDPKLDSAGTLIGQRLAVGRDATISAVGEVSPAGIASGPVEGAVVLVDDDGTTGQVKVVSVAGRCAAMLYSTSSVVRRAILDPADGSLAFHLLDRATRADLGVWLLPSGSATAGQLLAPLDASSGLGRVWATDLRFDAAGTRLAVQSCLDLECLTRIVDLSDPTAEPTVVRGPSQGPMLGFAGSSLLTWAACDGLPCEILEWDRATGRSRSVIKAASAASLTADGSTLVALVDGDSGADAVAVDLQRGSVTPLQGLAAGEGPLPVGGDSIAGYEASGTSLAVSAPGGSARVVSISAAGEVLP